MFDQLPHVGVAVHLAELAVEEPVSVSLAPGRSRGNGSEEVGEERAFKTAPRGKRGFPDKGGQEFVPRFW